MTRTREYDLVAIGGGTAGLVSGAGAAYIGASSAIVEKHRLGGDCLWTGCVPSKALIASARLAHAMRNADRLGLVGASPAQAFADIMARVHRARATVARHDDPERFRAMGVDVHLGHARFLGPDTLEVDGIGPIRSKRIVIASGARPVAPPIPGLDQAGYVDHESAFEKHHLPRRIVVLGGGPVGLEFAQVYARLGAAVTVLEKLPRLLQREDPDVSELMRTSLESEGVRVLTGTAPTKVEACPGGKVVSTSSGTVIEADEIFVATGRRPNTAGLDLERAGVELDGAAIRVDRTLRTTAPTVWAAGDVTGGLQFTHVADYMAKTVLRNAVFPGRARVDYGQVPWVTYTDPEVARVGLSQAEAEERGGHTYTYDFSDLDRAIVDGDTRGMVKISADRKGRILGATIVGGDAGELIFPVVLAMKHGLTLAQVSNTIFPYPTRVEGVKRAADAFQRSRLEGLGGTVLRKVVSWLT
jgi:pyruvate/2-oxoglutarate dehydrogenase complex dihydrolipoamide dehydrogenase (E3) component